MKVYCIVKKENKELTDYSVFGGYAIFSSEKDALDWLGLGKGHGSGGGFKNPENYEIVIYDMQLKEVKKLNEKEEVKNKAMTVEEMKEEIKEAALKVLNNKMVGDIDIANVSAIIEDMVRKNINQSIRVEVTIDPNDPRILHTSVTSLNPNIFSFKAGMK